MVKPVYEMDDDARLGRGNNLNPYNFICHAVWAEVNEESYWIHLQEAFHRLKPYTGYSFRRWPDETRGENHEVNRAETPKPQRRSRRTRS